MTPVRPAVLGIAGFGLIVPDLALAERFYLDYGLEACGGDATRRFRSPGRDAAEVTVSPGAKKRLHFVSFHIPAGSEAEFAERLQRHGIATAAAPGAELPAGLWFQDPWGTWFHLSTAPMQPLGEIALPAYNFGGRSERVDIALWTELKAPRGPLKLGHILLFTPEWERAEAFYSEVLGLRTTDRTSGKVCFMAAGDGVIDHHCFGLIRDRARGFQHASFQVADFDEIGLNAWRMREAGYREAFGPGRHALASNLFHYVRDPWGSWIEYYADMDKISPEWECRDWQNLPYIWGPGWSPEFWGKEMNANFEAD